MAKTDIKKALTTLTDNNVAKMKRADVEALGTTLAGVQVNEMTDEKDKAAFLQVGVLVKTLTSAVKAVITKIDDKHKPEIKELDAKLDKLKTAYKDAVAPYKAVNAELSRIDAEARNAVTDFMTKVIGQERADVAAPAPGDAPVFVSAPENHNISRGGHELTFTTKKVTKITDLRLVPDNLATWAPDEAAVRAWLKASGIHDNFELKTQADGTLALKIPVTALPANMRKKTGVKERVVVDLGGCPGVELVDEHRPVVR